MQNIEKELIEKAASGDMAAFREIYEKTASYVYRVAYRITNAKEDAPEVTQDVFLKIYRNLKLFKFQASFKTWIYKITTNTSINLCKKRNKETGKRNDFDETSRTVGSFQEPKDFLKEREDRGKLETLLSNLNKDQRACIVLREIEELNYREIAQVLRTNINTVRSRLKRAREILFALAKKEVSYGLQKS